MGGGQLSWVEFHRGGGGNCPGGSCPAGSFRGNCLGSKSQTRICPGENFMGGSCPGELSLNCVFYDYHNGSPYSSIVGSLILMLIFIMGNINSFNCTDVLKLHYWCFIYEINLHERVSLSRHKQICLMRLHFERYFTHHRAT